MTERLADEAQSESAHDYRLSKRRKRWFSPQTSDRVEEFTAVVEDKEAYRRVLRFRGRQAEGMLDVWQTVLDYAAPYSDLWKHGTVALQRLSIRSGVFPSLYELNGVKRLRQEAEYEGGYGEVYPGEYDGNRVCIKMLRINRKDREKVMKFYVREAILWAQLSHRNILPFYGVCTLDSKPCLVSPWATNGNVREYLESNPRADRLALVQDMTAGLHYLHSRDIIHGDLKGANVLVDSKGCAYLSDFGLSSVYDKRILDWTSQSAAVSSGGTVRWQAPELLQEEARNTKESDMYAWGCTCFEIFTGEVPYARTTTLGLVYVQKMQGVRPACASRGTQAWIDAGLDDDTWALLDKCWDYRPGDRPTVRDVCIQTGGQRRPKTVDTFALYTNQLPRAPPTFFFLKVR